MVLAVALVCFSILALVAKFAMELRRALEARPRPRADHLDADGSEGADPDGEQDEAEPSDASEATIGSAPDGEEDAAAPGRTRAGQLRAVSLGGPSAGPETPADDKPPPPAPPWVHRARSAKGA